MNIFQDIYTKFVGRDVFGKAVPGILLLWVSSAALTTPTSAVDFYSGLGWPAWLVLLGPSWLIGWAMQNLGRLIRLIRLHPDPEDFYHPRLSLLVARLPDATRAQIERAVILKEASGNAVVGLLLCLAVAATDVMSFHRTWLEQQWQLVAVLAVAFTLLEVALLWGHGENVLFQYNLSMNAISSDPSISNEEREALDASLASARGTRHDAFWLLVRLRLLKPQSWTLSSSKPLEARIPKCSRGSLQRLFSALARILSA